MRAPKTLRSARAPTRGPTLRDASAHAIRRTRAKRVASAAAKFTATIYARAPNDARSEFYLFYLRVSVARRGRPKDSYL